jgi:hypothetical protein
MRAFPDPDQLEFMLWARLDKHLAQLVPAKVDYRVLTYRLLQATEAEGWTSDLILAACAERPGNKDLAAIAEPIGLVPEFPADLEQMVSERGGLHDVASWRAELWRTEARVCHIESPVGARTQMSGTGFLISSDLILTNYHVVSHLVEGRGDPANTRLRFDYKRHEDGAAVSDGVAYPLASAWLVSSSPPGAVEQGSASGGIPSEGELDYALLRLAEEVGQTPAGPINDPAGLAPRGWVDLTADTPLPEAGEPVMIVQHPEGRPLQLALDVVLRVNDNATRVHYKTNTLYGSSGSPCFNLRWQLMALHQSRGPFPRAERTAPYNQGIPARTIVERLAAEGLRDELAATPG